MTTRARRCALLTVAEMSRADREAVARGVTGEALMEAAGAAVAREIRRRWASRPTIVLCGPGNNGGDGFVVARLLADAGWPVEVALLGARAALAGEAAAHAARWDGAVRPIEPSVVAEAGLVVDAVFGAGLARPVEGAVAATLEAVDARDIPCIAVDMPSGVHGDTGAVLGTAARAELTVTFFRRKPGHVLLPGRLLAGEVVVADIGIPEDVLDEIAPAIAANAPELWLDRFPWPQPTDHKYSRGHAVIVGGVQMTGAARLAARAALRIGAGLVTVASSPEGLAVYRLALEGVLTAAATNAEEFAALFADPRKNAALIGPGAGVSRTTRNMVLAALAAGRAVVLDADALTVFSDERELFYASLRDRNCLITPHDGEFGRVFDSSGDRLKRARTAAREARVAVLLKGADTVIAAPDGRAAINENAPPELATAGAGDVLAGLALGLMAQGMDPFGAGCAASWIHGEAARAFGPGLIAADLPDLVPPVLKALAGRAGR